MTKIMLFISLLAQACGLSYHQATSHQYLGEDTYEITANGNAINSGNQMSGFVVRRAYELCKSEHQSGFKIVGRQNTGSSTTNYNINSYGRTTTVNSYDIYKPGQAMVVKCMGPVDQTLERNFIKADQEEKAKKDAEEVKKLDTSKYGSN